MAKVSRKTYSVAKLLYMTNSYLAHPDSTPDGREQACVTIEAILHGSGNYCGYKYLDTAEINGNGTRRFYFVHNNIHEEYETNPDENDLIAA